MRIWADSTAFHFTANIPISSQTVNPTVGVAFITLTSIHTCCGKSTIFEKVGIATTDVSIKFVWDTNKRWIATCDWVSCNYREEVGQLAKLKRPSCSFSNGRAIGLWRTLFKLNNTYIEWKQKLNHIHTPVCALITTDAWIWLSLQESMDQGIMSWPGRPTKKLGLRFIRCRCCMYRQIFSNDRLYWDEFHSWLRVSKNSEAKSEGHAIVSELVFPKSGGTAILNTLGLKDPRQGFLLKCSNSAYMYLSWSGAMRICTSGPTFSIQMLVGLHRAHLHWILLFISLVLWFDRYFKRSNIVSSSYVKDSLARTVVHS